MEKDFDTWTQQKKKVARNLLFPDDFHIDPSLQEGEPNGRPHNDITIENNIQDQNEE